MDIQDILVKFERNDGSFPREAVEAAIACREAIVPELLRILEHTTVNAEALAENCEYTPHLFALFLLAQFREQKAYPLIVDLFCLPREQTYQLTGDLTTESLGQLLASVCGDDIGLIKSMIENKEINEYVRGAAMESLICLAASGVLSVAEITAYFKTLFNGGLEREFSQVWNSLVANTALLCSSEMLADVERAFADDLVEPFFVDLSTAKKMLAEDHGEKLQRLSKDSRLQLIDDTVKEMQRWSCFQPEKPIRDVPAKRHPASVKVGRNDPCPCGSGKKYKKCCLRR